MTDDRESEGELPAETVAEAERLTRLAREADGRESETYRERRADLLAEHGFTARVRRDDAGETLVVHPAEWVDDGRIDPAAVDDLDRALERSLSGPGDPEDWRALDEHNRDLAARVRAERGDVHGDNADALAAFAGDHYAKRIEDLTGDELREFLEEYFPRNAWPSDDQRAVVGESVEATFAAADERVPEF
jgi:hypothetical protein